MAIVRAKTAFSVGTRFVRPGDLIDTDDPIYPKREALFEAVEDAVERHRANVEQATAEPGEKRSVTIGRRAPVGEKKPRRSRTAKKAAEPPAPAAPPETSAEPESGGDDSPDEE